MLKKSLFLHKRKAGWHVILSFLFTLPLAPAYGADALKRTPDEVLVVYNADSPVSRTIADDYARKRNVQNVLSIQCRDSALNTDNETITLTDYTSRVENPIREYLAAHTNIDFIVLTKGIPIRITGSAMGSCDEHSTVPVEIRGHPSVDSTLAALDYTNRPGALKINITGSGARRLRVVQPLLERDRTFFTTPGSAATWSPGWMVTPAGGCHGPHHPGPGGGSTICTNGKVLFDVQPIFGPGQPDVATRADLRERSSSGSRPWNTYNADMRLAHDLMVKRAIPDELEVTETFIGGRTNLLGYFFLGQ